MLLFTVTMAQEKIDNDFYTVDENVGLSDQQKAALSKSFKEAEQLKTDNPEEISKSKLDQLKSVLTDYQFVVHLRSHSEVDAEQMVNKKIGEIASMKNISYDEAKRYEKSLKEYYWTVAMAQKRYAFEEDKLKQNLNLLWNTAPPIIKELDMKLSKEEGRDQEARIVGVDFYKNQYHW